MPCKSKHRAKNPLLRRKVLAAMAGAFVIGGIVLGGWVVNGHPIPTGCNGTTPCDVGRNGDYDPQIALRAGIIIGGLLVGFVLGLLAQLTERP